MRVRPRLTCIGMVVGITLLPSGAAAAVSHPLTNDPVLVKANAPRTARTQSTSDARPDAGTLECSVYGVPTLDAPTIARSTMSEGAPYVIVCDDATGMEVLNAVFIHRLGP